MWEVWYDLEASNCLADNGSLVSELFFACESLAENSGWPRTDTYEEDEGFIFWRSARHLIIYRRLEMQKIAQIAALIPD